MIEMIGHSIMNRNKVEKKCGILKSLINEKKR